MSSLLGVLAFEIRLVLARPFARWMLAGVIAAGIGSVALSGATPEEAWIARADAMKLQGLLALLLGGILGATTLGPERASGAQRMLFLQPVARPLFFLSRGLVLVAFQGLAIALGLVAITATAALLGLGTAEADVLRGGVVILDREEMATLSSRLLWLQTAAGLVAPVVGLLAASFFKDVATALLFALPVLLAPGMLTVFGLEVDLLWVPAQALASPQALKLLAEGVTTDADAIEFGPLLGQVLLAAAGWLSLTMAGGCLRYATLEDRG